VFLVPLLLLLLLLCSPANHSLIRHCKLQQTHVE
jgi:hypothetical protein